TAPIQVAPTLTLVDPDNTQLSSATVRIASAYALGEDVLLFTDAYGITGQWDVDQGLLTLNGLASVEDYQLALRSVSYQNLSEAPDAQARTLELQVSDSGLSSNVGTCTLTVLTQPDAPVVTPGVSQITYVENATPLQVMGAALLITDVDSTALSRAVITISTAYVQGQDTLTFVDQAGITGTWSENTGTLTLSGYASLSDWQAALQSIRYVNSSDRPSETARDLTLTVHDGSVDSAPVTWRLDVQAVNDTPVLSSDGVTPSYTENAASIAVADGLTISDLDHDVLSQATIHIVGHVPAQDLLSFTNSGDITGQWDADLGTLTLSGNASLADYEAALALVRYTNLSDDPDTSPRTIEITVSDGSLAQGAVLTRSLSITALNDAPVLVATGSGIGYQENAPATEVCPELQLSDVDNSTLTGATVWISAGHVSGQDVLSVDAGAGIGSQWDAEAGILTLSGNATLADYEAALRSIRYANLSEQPVVGTRTVSLEVMDASDPSAVLTQTILVSAVNDSPVAQPSQGQATHQENAAGTWLDTGLVLNDVDNNTLVGATLRITGNHVLDQDRLSIVTQGGIEWQWDATSGTLTLSGSASVADYQAALRSVLYLNDSDDPDTASRTITLVLDDGAADNPLSDALHYTIDVVASNDAPTIVGSTGTLNYLENGTPLRLDEQIDLFDLDNAVLNSATVRFSEGYAAGQDVLAFQDADGIVGTWHADTGTLVLSGVASVADYQLALRSITYVNGSDNPSAGTRTLLMSVSDGQAAHDVSTPITRQVVVTPINDAPVITSSGTVSLIYTENSGAVSLGRSVSLSDVDNLLLEGATVRIDTHYVQGQDILALQSQGGISSSWDAATGTLTLQGIASLSDYQDALDRITYTNTSDHPDASTRTVSIGLHDGESSSVAMASPAMALSILPVNDAPVISLNRLNIQQGSQATPELIVSDAEQTAGQLQLTASAMTGGQFIDLTSGQAVSTFTVQEINAGTVVFVHDGSGTVPGYQLTVSDGIAVTLASPPDVTMIRNIQISAPVSTPEPGSDSTAPQDEAPVSETVSDEATSAAANLVAETQAAPPSDTTALQRDSLELRRAALVPPPAVEFSMTASPVRISIESQARVSGSPSPVDVQISDFIYRWTGSLPSGAAAEELNRSLNALREQLTEQDNNRQQMMVSSIALTTGLSMGYVIWLLRGGALLGSMLSSMPLWGMIDPLPILNRASGKHALADGTDADAPLEQLFDGEHPTPPPPPEAPANPTGEQRS
ncbi:MAG TPA: cadherin-like domain-containing protein, partial [Aquabacterium sp.]|uniref:cadherin-like domain-containing protein n=1 Tax=Aquabacterium sp. TaxID=1872578 RepID=UPI002E363C7A